MAHGPTQRGRAPRREPTQESAEILRRVDVETDAIRLCQSKQLLDLELPQPAGEDEERHRDDADEPGEAAVELGHPRRGDVAVELQH